MITGADFAKWLRIFNVGSGSASGSPVITDSAILTIGGIVTTSELVGAIFQKSSNATAPLDRIAWMYLSAASVLVTENNTLATLSTVPDGYVPTTLQTVSIPCHNPAGGSDTGTAELWAQIGTDGVVTLGLQLAYAHSGQPSGVFQAGDFFTFDRILVPYRID